MRVVVVLVVGLMACDDGESGSITRIPIGRDGGFAQDGAIRVVPDGALPDGAVPDGAVPDGAVPDGALPDGMIIRDAGADPDVDVPEPDGFIPDPDGFIPDPDAAPPEPDAAPPEPDAAPRGLAVLGGDTHDLANVRLTILADRNDGLAVPRDLAFNPQEPGELWIVNRRDDSVTVLFDAMEDDSPESLHRVDPYALHFMEEPSSIAFGARLRFATCQESRNTYNNQAAPNDFMGPALWSSDLDVFGRTNPDAVDFVGFDLGSHLDMLHESPLCMGIEWQQENVYFIFEGMTNSICRADFREDHGPGFDDHSDGVMERFAIGDVRRVADIPSHLLLQGDTLFIADTGNARIATLDISTGRRGRQLRVVERGTQLFQMDGHDPVETFFEDPRLVHPSGIVRSGDHLFISDNATGIIWALTLDGEVVDYLDTELPRGALMGLEADRLGRIYAVDAVNNQVFRIAPR